MSGVIRSIPGPTIRSCQERRDVSVMGVSFRVVLSFRFRVEGPFAAPLPEREGVALALRAGGQIEPRALERCSIVVGQFDEPGFLDEAAPLYEMAGPFATPHEPSSDRKSVGTGKSVSVGVRTAVHRLLQYNKLTQHE